MILINIVKIRNEIKNGKNLYDMNLRVVYYARVSTDKDEQINSLENQKNYFEELINEEKNWILSGSYIDEGISGTSVKKRESFLKMINDAKKGKFDMILTKEVSRFARNTIDSIKYTQYLLEKGVIVNFINDNINTVFSDSEFRLTLMSSLAQDEVRKLSERVKFGFKRSIKDGRVLGGGNITGYDKRNGKLYINEKEAKMIRMLFDLYVSNGYGFKKISKILFSHGYKNTKGEMYSERVLSRMITNTKYKGYYCANKSYVENYRTHKKILKPKSEWIMYKDENIPVIIDEKIFDEANRIYNEKRKVSKRNLYNIEKIYAGKLICNCHNKNFSIISSGNRKNKPVWVCQEYIKNGVEGCLSPILEEEKLNDIFKKLIKENFFLDDKLTQNILSDYVKIINFDNKKEELIKVKNKIILSKEKILELFMEDIITKDEYKVKNDSYNKELENINEKIKSIDKYDNKNDIKKIENKIQKFLNIDNSYKDLFKILIDKVIVEKCDGDRNNIKLNIYFNSNKIIGIKY